MTKSNGKPKVQVFAVEFCKGGRNLMVNASLLEGFDLAQIEAASSYLRQLDRGDQKAPAGLDERHREAVKDFRDDAVERALQFKAEMPSAIPGFALVGAHTVAEAVVKAARAVEGEDFR